MKTYPFVKQTEINDCGPACLKMIIKYYHGNYSLEKIKLMANTNNQGTTAYDLMQVAKKLGFKTEAYKLNIDTLFSEQIKLPCIAHTIINNRYLHYVVIYKIEKDLITIADPNKKIMKITKKKFNEIFNSIIIILKPIKKLDNYSDYYDLKKLTLKMVKENNKYYKKIWFNSFIITILSIVTMSFTKIFLDNLLNIKTILLLLLIYLILVSIKHIIVNTKNKLEIKLNNIIDYDLTTNLYETLFNLPYQYYCNHETGEIIKKIEELKKARNTIVFITDSILIYLPLSIISIIILGKISIYLLIICLINIIFNFILITKQQKKNLNNIENIHLEEENINAYLYTSISNIIGIKGINKEKEIINFFKKSYNIFTCKLTNTIKTILINNEKINYINNIVDGLILFIGCVLIKYNKINLITFFLFLTLKEIIYIPITSYQTNNINIEDGIASIKRLSDLNTIIVKSVNNKEKLNGNLYIKNIKYKFKNKIINQNYNLKIKKGEKIFLTGPSGSGKTTLLNIIYKNLKINNNSLFIDNIDINKIDNQTIKNNITYICSKEIIFNGTIDENLMIENETNRNKIKEICLIENENININSDKKSDGEKQKINLARALSNDSEIYLIDEALNKIDINNERIILKNIFNRFSNKTFIIVSHRLDNMDLFDKVVKVKSNNIEIVKRR